MIVNYIYLSMCFHELRDAMYKLFCLMLELKLLKMSLVDDFNSLLYLKLKMHMFLLKNELSKLYLTNKIEQRTMCYIFIIKFTLDN